MPKQIGGWWDRSPETEIGVVVGHALDRHGERARDCPRRDSRLNRECARDVEPEHLERGVEGVKGVERRGDHRQTRQETGEGLRPRQCARPRARQMPAGVVQSRLVEGIGGPEVRARRLLHQLVAHRGARAAHALHGRGAFRRNNFG